jgi:hypothetical protein
VGTPAAAGSQAAPISLHAVVQHMMNPSSASPMQKPSPLGQQCLATPHGQHTAAPRFMKTQEAPSCVGAVSNAYKSSQLAQAATSVGQACHMSAACDKHSVMHMSRCMNAASRCSPLPHTPHHIPLPFVHRTCPASSCHTRSTQPTERNCTQSTCSMLKLSLHKRVIHRDALHVMRRVAISVDQIPTKPPVQDTTQVTPTSMRKEPVSHTSVAVTA